MHIYYFAAASKNFLMRQEPVEEILRERRNHYKSLNKEIDFWLVSNISDIPYNFQSICANSKNQLAAIISSNPKFIKWLKLRIGFVYIGEFQSKNILNFR